MTALNQGHQLAGRVRQAEPGGFAVHSYYAASQLRFNYFVGSLVHETGDIGGNDVISHVTVSLQLLHQVEWIHGKVGVVPVGTRHYFTSLFLRGVSARLAT
jgi:hypothetical protein